MSEEEKKAIEYWQYVRDTQIYDGYKGQVYSVVLLNLIEKLEKELEKEKEKNEELEEQKNINYYEWKHLEADMINNYISKDKIRAKIEELEIEILQCEYADDDTEEYKKDVEAERYLLLRDKHILEELLEEE